jgi:hypothetical protein
VLLFFYLSPFPSVAQLSTPGRCQEVEFTLPQYWVLLTECNATVDVSCSHTAKAPSSSSSSFIGEAGGNPAYRTSAFEAVCTFNPVLVPHSSPEALHTRQRERPLLANRGSMAGQILPDNPTSTKLLGSLTCRKTVTWDRRLYFPSEGRHSRKIRRLRSGLNTRTWVPEASMLTTRPPKPLRLRFTLCGVLSFSFVMWGRVVDMEVLTFRRTLLPLTQNIWKIRPAGSTEVLAGVYPSTRLNTPEDSLM